MSDSVETLSALRAQLAADWSAGGNASHGVFASGHASLDACLDGGFQRGQLHEILAGDAGDNGSAAGFAAMLALRSLQPGKSILWFRTRDAISKGGRFNPGGFAELGGDPARFFMAVADNATALLRSAADALRCDGFAAVIIECWGSPAILDLTASRRLTLAAGSSGIAAIMLRPGGQEQPSTAHTRWSVQSAPSTPLEANAPGHPVLDLTLLRRRAGPAGRNWRVEWDRDQQLFREPARAQPALQPFGKAPLPRPVVPLFGTRQAAAPAPPGARIKHQA